jgi:O-antigen ligase
MFNLISIPIVLILFVNLISNSLDDARNIDSLFIAGDISMEETSTLARVVQLDSGWEAIKQRPILGYGLGNAAQAISRSAVDNYYLSIFIETGILGFGILLLLLYRRINLGVRGIKQYKDPLLICLVCSCAIIISFYFILSIVRANLILFPLLALVNLRYKELQGMNEN